MPSTQMNTRIDADVKAAGDSVFGKIGYTPSQVVRIIWGYAARNAGNVGDVAHLLRMAEGVDEQEERGRLRKVELAESGPKVFDDFLAQIGLPKDYRVERGALTPSETRERAAIERAIEKGWIDA